MKNVYILGTTGTIGLQAVEVILKHPKEFKVIGISLGNSNKDLHEKLINDLKPEVVHFRSNNTLFKKYSNTTFYYGDSGLIEFLKYPVKGIVINGISGSAGLIPSIETIKAKKDLALANKESLVMAGEIIKDLVKKYQVKLIPIDSEHNAILSSLVGEEIKSVKEITITASGGSFRDLTKAELENVKLKEALNHPNWEMGKKITIDSATMVNKALEVIEAHYLFDLDYDKIKVLLHRESVVHGFVTFKDNSVKALLASPNMKMPILYALTYPNRLESGIDELNLTNLNLSFAKIDDSRYPLLKLGYEVGIKKGLYPVVFNASNEAAVNLFLNEKIKFTEIEEIIVKEVNNFKENISNPTLEEIIETDELIKRKVYMKYGFYY